MLLNFAALQHISIFLFNHSKHHDCVNENNKLQFTALFPSFAVIKA